MRIATPCTENLDAMPRAGLGVHCTKCDRDVVDLRRVPSKRALAVIDALRAQGDGKVCVRVRATRDGVPVFAKDPSPLSRFALPMALAGSLAACAPSVGAGRGTSPVAVLPVGETTAQEPGNGNGTSASTSTSTSTTVPVVVPVGHAPLPTQQPGVGPVPEHVEMAGGLAFSGP